MASILSLETSSKICSVAIHENGVMLAGAEVHTMYSHGSKLAPLIEDVKNLTGIDWNDISAIAISSGPGSYTGLRIGVATAKGLCYSLGIPLIAINTLDLLAFQMRNLVSSNTLLCPMIDARRMEVYCKVVDKELNEIVPVQSSIITEDSFKEILSDQTVVFFGDGAMKCQAVIRSNRALFVEGINAMASQLGVIANEKFIEAQFEDLVSFEPFYLKEFQVKKSTKRSVES